VPLHQHSAVDRNRLKRRLRELTRLTLLPALRTRPPLDVVIRARREAYAAPLDALRADVSTVHARVTSLDATT
jgi:ribonuclease P protein component